MRPPGQFQSVMLASRPFKRRGTSFIYQLEFGMQNLWIRSRRRLGAGRLDGQKFFGETAAVILQQDLNLRWVG